jgi:phosphate transport system substrate-binding protein
VHMSSISGDPLLSLIKIIMATVLMVVVFLHSCTCAPRGDTVRIDGSSTVYVLSEAIAEEYQKMGNGKVSIGISGTGGGFKKLCSKRIDLVGASRSITGAEKDLCQQNSVEYIELPVAYDGIVVVVNKENDWLSEINVSTLKKMFEPEAEGKIMQWSDIDPSWPERKFEIFAPGISSGTYDYFTRAIVGKEHSSRGDLTSSEDDNVIVHGVRSTKDSIGFFSFAYFLENKDELKVLPIIDDIKQKNIAVLPSAESIRNGSYSPLSRPIFIYINKNLDESAKKFIHFYLDHSQKVAQDVGFIPLNDLDQHKAWKALKGE